MNDAPASIFVELGVRAEAPRRDMPRLLWLWLQMRSPRSDGLSSNEEAPTLNAFEDALETAVAKLAAGVYVGRITTRGRREFYFYADSAADLRSAAAAAASKFQNYQYACGERLDESWSHYLDVLHPTDEEMQRIQNRAVVLSLQKNGDTLSAPRSVDHWLYFSSDSEVEAAVERVVQLGFIVGERSSTADSKPGRRLLLRIRREDRVDLAAINEVTTLLFRIANECGGEYDGWESPVVRDA